MSKFIPAFGFVLGIETEKLTNHEWDNGGLTKYGISQKAFPNLDIANLTFGRARELFRSEYWDRNRCDELPWIFALPLFDAAVLQGGTGRKAFQKALGVVVDGVIGSKTIAAANAVPVADREEVLSHFLSWRAKRFPELEDWEIAGRGWMRRLFLLQQKALKEVV